jgi:hypothetical protein
VVTAAKAWHAKFDGQMAGVSIRGTEYKRCKKENNEGGNERNESYLPQCHDIRRSM